MGFQVSRVVIFRSIITDPPDTILPAPLPDWKVGKRIPITDHQRELGVDSTMQWWLDEQERLKQKSYEEYLKPKTFHFETAMTKHLLNCYFQKYPDLKQERDIGSETVLKALNLVSTDLQKVEIGRHIRQNMHCCPTEEILKILPHLRNENRRQEFFSILSCDLPAPKNEEKVYVRVPFEELSKQERNFPLQRNI
eukprot:TRINITY_DN3026_c0_g1_i1.p1 TRINITY_DN3026_c0_g1~~TRINITY_DN3026_c0_g1_i1.p1  ORF type:complete len:195 (+),score=25.07 TRINITY_DN3026_c0_g1_i1:158-742(+)